MRVRLLTASDVARLVGEVGLGEFVDGLISSLEGLLRRWRELRVVPRTSFQYPGGVMEAMPAGDEHWFAVKVVNGHPGNPLRGLSTVVALGVLADAETGYPLLVADATLLTAFRTGAASAVATKYLARRDGKTLGIVGTGAQSEFLCFSVSRVVPVEKVVFYDVDPRAMMKFEANMSQLGFELEAAGSAREVAERGGVVITATAARGRHRVLAREWVRPGVHINAVGGDAPGKTELDPRILLDAKVVVELLDQALVEGEVQNVGRDAVYAELWEVVSGVKPGRVSDEEVTVFDSVGVAFEDLAALTYLYELAEEAGAGSELELVPLLKDPKDLFSLVLRAERRLLAGRGGAGSSLELGGDGVKQVLRQRKD
jgi:ornithine cyclodeaminase/alanine dehydrogenase-like protein (mu-crystallin family)